MSIGLERKEMAARKVRTSMSATAQKLKFQIDSLSEGDVVLIKSVEGATTCGCSDWEGEILIQGPVTISEGYHYPERNAVFLGPIELTSEDMEDPFWGYNGSIVELKFISTAPIYQGSVIKDRLGTIWLAKGDGTYLNTSGAEAQYDELDEPKIVYRAPNPANASAEDEDEDD
jgi:hypothetical protein